MSNNITIRNSAGVVETMRTLEVAGVHTPVSRIEGYDAADDMLKVKSVQKKFRDSFSGASLNAALWDSTVGTGGSISVGSGVLTMASGTTINSETSATTKETFTIPFRVQIGLTLSQRIINQEFFVEAISVDPVTLVPNGQHSCSWRFDAATATQAIYETQNGGLARLASAASTVVTTASGGLYELEPFSDEVWWHSATLDATTARANSYRRHQQIPDPNGVYKLRLRWLNGGTAPATSTNAVVQFISCQDYAELTAEITASRGQVVAGQALGVAVISAPSTVVTVGAAGIAVAPVVPATPYILNSAASTNGALILTGTSGLQAFYATNTGATAAFVKLFNKATAPTVGTDVPAMIIPVPAAVSGVPGIATLPIGFSGFRFALGLGIAITGAVGDTDTTAVAAGQVKVMLSRTV